METNPTRGEDLSRAGSPEHCTAVLQAADHSGKAEAVGEPGRLQFEREHKLHGSNECGRDCAGNGAVRRPVTVRLCLHNVPSRSEPERARS